MNISQTLKSLSKTLQSNLSLSALEAKVEAERIVMHFLGLDHSDLVLYSDKDISYQHNKLISKCLEIRIQGYPLAYILKKAYFYSREFDISNAVLIPRPETEYLVDKAKKILAKTESPSILEIGTGSGCISISLACELKKQCPQIVATDISNEALEILHNNSTKHNVTSYIQGIQCDLVTDEIAKDRYHLLISNPPYINPIEYESLSQEVKEEPYLALVGNNSNITGLDYYQRIAALKIKAENILLELDDSRAEIIKEIFQSHYPTMKIEIISDLNGFKRYLVGT